MPKKKAKIELKKISVPSALRVLSKLQKRCDENTSHMEYEAIVMEEMAELVDFSNTKHENYESVLNDFDLASDLKDCADEIIRKMGEFFKKKP